MQLQARVSVLTLIVKRRKLHSDRSTQRRDPGADKHIRSAGAFAHYLHGLLLISYLEIDFAGFLSFEDLCSVRADADHAYMTADKFFETCNVLLAVFGKLVKA